MWPERGQESVTFADRCHGEGSDVIPRGQQPSAAGGEQDSRPQLAARERMRRFPGSTTFPSLFTALARQHVAHPRPGDASNSDHETSDNAGHPRHPLGDTTSRKHLHDRCF